MSRKQEDPEKEPNHERWLVSYGDLLTLLFAVFVTLYAMSQADVKKAEEASASMREAFGINSNSGSSRKPSVLDTGKTGVIPEIPNSSSAVTYNSPRPGAKPLANESDFRAIKRSIDAYLLKVGAAGKVTVSVDRRGLVLSLKEAGFFDSGSAALKNGSADLVGTVADLIAEYSNKCRVEGHTDDVPIRTQQFGSNWDLSTARATCLVKELTRGTGVDPKLISAVGYAEYHPVADNHTAEGRAQNRRVDVVILSGNTMDEIDK